MISFLDNNDNSYKDVSPINMDNELITDLSDKKPSKSNKFITILIDSFSSTDRKQHDEKSSSVSSLDLNNSKAN
jgi:hypothetical protein